MVRWANDMVKDGFSPAEVNRMVDEEPYGNLPGENSPWENHLIDKGDDYIGENDEWESPPPSPIVTIRHFDYDREHPPTADRMPDVLKPAIGYPIGTKISYVFKDVTMRPPVMRSGEGTVVHRAKNYTGQIDHRVEGHPLTQWLYGNEIRRPQPGARRTRCARRC